MQCGDLGRRCADRALGARRSSRAPIRRSRRTNDSHEPEVRAYPTRPLEKTNTTLVVWVSRARRLPARGKDPVQYQNFGDAITERSRG
jgi:hypothetical protein